MAFIDFSTGFSSHCSRAAEVLPREARNLSPLEQSASDIGSHDPLSSIRDETVLRRWFNGMFDIRRPAPLADPKLEAIRRLTVAAHLAREPELAQETRAALAIGLNPLQTVTILNRFGRTAAA